MRANESDVWLIGFITATATAKLRKPHTSLAMPDDIDSAWRSHLRWQRHLLKGGGALPEGTGFIVLRPGDARTVCTKDHLATGSCVTVPNSRARIHASRSGEHWDDVVLRAATLWRRGLHWQRLLPGLGNIAVAFASAAVAAILSRRVLLLENWTMAHDLFDTPLPELLLERGGWEAELLRAQSANRGSGGSPVHLFLASDNVDSSSALCSASLQSLQLQREARVVRVLSNQYFLPLLYLNPHHRPQLQDWWREGGGRGFWGPLTRALFRPKPHLLARVDATARRLGIVDDRADGRAVLTLHLRCMRTLDGRCRVRGVLDKYAECAARRARATNAGSIFIATMLEVDRQKLTAALAERLMGANVSVVHTEGPPAGKVQSGVSTMQEELRIVDTWLLARGTELLLSPHSTMGYMALALVPEARRVTMLDTCEPPLTREASFHHLQRAVSRNQTCQAVLPSVERACRVDRDAQACAMMTII